LCILNQYAQGLVPAAIASAQQVSFGTVRRVLREAGVDVPRYLLQWEASDFGRDEPPFEVAAPKPAEDDSLEALHTVE
jgi:hypothetical protein